MNPRRKILALMVVPVLVFLLCTTGYALNFNLIPLFDPMTYPDALQGFQDAATLWENEFTDPVTVNLEIGFEVIPDAPSGAAIVGQTDVTNAVYGYVPTRTALQGDATSSADTAANARLQVGTDFDVLMNFTAQNSGSITPYLYNGVAADASTYVSNANAKALGMYAGDPNAVDAKIVFNSNFGWDFDQSDGITAGQRDFTGVAAHEIAHALGFLSGVDRVDQNANDGFFANDFAYVNGWTWPPPPDPDAEDFAAITVMDLFRVSALSEIEGVGVLDLTADTRSKYYISLTGDDLFSTGLYNGNGYQAAHWFNNSYGLMGPTSTDGVLYSIQANDVEMLDVIGWNIDGGIGPQVPEPGTMLLLSTGLIGLAAFRRKFKN